jgi:anti-sigma factor RsiW
MNCKKHQKRLHLYREGELSGRQVKSLDRHLERCPHCAAVLRRIGRLEATVGRMRDEIPQMKHPEMISGRIMNAIAGMSGDSRRAERSAFSAIQDVDRHSERVPVSGMNEESPIRAPKTMFHARKGIRFGLAAAAAAIVIVFFIQESVILSKISMLEERMAKPEMNSAMTIPARSGYPLTRDGIRKLPVAAVGAAAAGEEWIAVRTSDLEVLLRSVQDSRRFNAQLLKIIRKQYPGIRSLDAEMSIDSEKVIRMLRDNPMIVRELLQSSETGGQT